MLGVQLAELVVMSYAIRLQAFQQPEVSSQSGGTSPISHVLSQEEPGTARAGAGPPAQIPRVPPPSHTRPTITSPPASSDCVSEQHPPEHEITASHITHKLWCELLVNEDLI